jgi:hypothetical protein
MTGQKFWPVIAKDCASETRPSTPPALMRMPNRCSDQDDPLRRVETTADRPLSPLLRIGAALAVTGVQATRRCKRPPNPMACGQRGFFDRSWPNGRRLWSGSDRQRGWLSHSRSKALLYDGTATRLREGRCLVRDSITYYQLCSIEGGTLRAPAGEADDRSDAFALAIAAIDQTPRGGSRCSCERGARRSRSGRVRRLRRGRRPVGPAGRVGKPHAESCGPPGPGGPAGRRRA